MKKFLTLFCTALYFLPLSCKTQTQVNKTSEVSKVSEPSKQKPEASWTFMVYMAAANDLEVFAPRNIRQMQQIGSNARINIIVQHNTIEKNKHTSKTYLIGKDTKTVISIQEKLVDSGDPQMLVDFCSTTIAAYPAKQYALVLWNHGTGVIEPLIRSHISSSDLFSFSNSPELFRKKQHAFTVLPLRTTPRHQEKQKGICFNDASGKFLTEQQLCNALKTICATSLQGKKFDILGFDACLMSMVEVAFAVEPYADFMVASQDVERGTGWDYYYALYPFLSTTITPYQFGRHLVHAYAKAYKKTPDYTQTCLMLTNLSLLSGNISRVALLLHSILKNEESNKPRLAVKLSRNRHLCTHFDEPEFVDLYHFYSNLLSNISQITSEPQGKLCETLQELKHELELGTTLIGSIVIENMTGQAYPNARGVSIYFPEHTIHSSYRKSLFAGHTDWPLFLRSYLSAYKK